MKSISTPIKLFLLSVLCVLPVLAESQLPPMDITFDRSDTSLPYVVVIDTVGNPHNLWQVGRPQKIVFDSALSQPNAIVTDTLNKYPPNDTSSFILGLNDYRSSLPGFEHWAIVFSISFDYRLDVDIGSFGKIEYSLDTGRTWNLLAYPFMSSTVGWENCTFDCGMWPIEFGLGWYADTLQIKFTFISDSDIATGDGWMIDNIHVKYYSENVSSIEGSKRIELFPNPVGTNLNVSCNESIRSIVIRDVNGRTVREKKYSNKIVSIDVADLSKGYYYVFADGIIAGVFLKE